MACNLKFNPFQLNVFQCLLLTLLSRLTKNESETSKKIFLHVNFVILFVKTTFLCYMDN